MNVQKDEPIEQEHVQIKTHVRWNIHVKYLRCVQVDAMETKIRTVDDLQPLTFLDREVDHDGFVYQVAERLKCKILVAMMMMMMVTKFKPRDLL